MNVSGRVSLYLASQSPRRRDLLRQIGVEFELLPAGVDETPCAGERPRDHVVRLARDKAAAGVARMRERRLAPRPVLGADTCVVVDDVILGKPRDEAAARRMLRRLSGRSHRVLTAVAMASDGSIHMALSESTVTFMALSDELIGRYWRTGEPRGKAGAYAIQGRAGSFVARIEGSYSGIVGLPLFETRKLMKKAGVDCL